MVEESPECPEDLLPDLEEVFEEAVAQDRNQMQLGLLDALQDRARVTEEILEMDAASSAPDAPVQPPELAPDAAEMPAKPIMPNGVGNILQLMKTCLNLSAAFQSAEETATGKAALLRRLHLMQMPVEEFVKKARLEEGLLSPASLQIQCQPQGDNAWNRSQHELGQANRAASVLQTRLARAQHWAQAQKTFCENVQRANPRATAEDKGLAAVEFYHPERGDGKHQVVALNYDNRVQVGLVMSCFRGCIVRKKGQAEVQVRASKMFAGHLPASSTKLLHVARLQYDKTHNEFTVSLAEQCWAMDPVATVLGELSVLQAKASAIGPCNVAQGARHASWSCGASRNGGAGASRLDTAFYRQVLQ